MAVPHLNIWPEAATEQVLQADFFDGSIWNVLMALLSTINKVRLTLTFLGSSHGVYDTQWEQQERVIWKEQGNMLSTHRGNFKKQMEKISEFSVASKKQMKNFWVNKPESERLRNQVCGQIISNDPPEPSVFMGEKLWKLQRWSSRKDISHYVYRKQKMIC